MFRKHRKTEEVKQDTTSYHYDAELEWNIDYDRTIRESWESKYGISYEDCKIYHEQYSFIQSILKASNNLEPVLFECLDLGDTFTHRNLNGDVWASYKSPCNCYRCVYEERVRLVKQFDDLTEHMVRLNPNFDPENTPYEDLY